MVDYSGYGMPKMDFSVLGELPQVYEQAQLRGNRKRTLADMAQGGSIGDVAKKLFEVGDIEGGLSLSKLAEAQALHEYNRKRDERDFGFRQQEAQRAQGNVETGQRFNERDFGLRKQEIDRGQGNTEREFAFKQRQAEEAARGFDLREVDDGNGNKILVRTNKQTGQSTRVPIEGASTQPNNPFAAGGAMKEHEGKSALFADRAATAHEGISQFENIYKGPGGIMAGVAEKATNETLFTLVGAPEQQQQMMNHKRGFINALLRRESGAAIQPSEFASYDKEYFPQPGNPQSVIDNKRKHRAEVIAGLARESGRAYQPDYSFDPEGRISRKPKAVTPQGGIAPRAEVTATPKTMGDREAENAGIYDRPEVGQAREAISRGADPAKVKDRLRKMGIDPSVL